MLACVMFAASARIASTIASFSLFRDTLVEDRCKADEAEISLAARQLPMIASWCLGPVS